jgi:hypothetical protein
MPVQVLSDRRWRSMVVYKFSKITKESINDRLLQTLRIELRTFCVLDRNHNR